MTVSEAIFAGLDNLTVSIVVYRPVRAVLERTVASLGAALSDAQRRRASLMARVYLIDNDAASFDLTSVIACLREYDIDCVVLSGQGNVGYGRGHNLAIDKTAARYHLILNPDVELEREALANALDFLDQYLDVGLLTPFIGDENGRIQYLCRRYPTVFDLFVRGFLPERFRVRFAVRFARYEMRDAINTRDIVWDPPIVSGCFMLFRTTVLKSLGGFDARYFLYFEDYDLSLRTHAAARIAYVPAIRVRHFGGGASRKGWLHIRLFAASAVKFFNRFGWRIG